MIFIKERAGSFGETAHVIEAPSDVHTCEVWSEMILGMCNISAMESKP